MGRGYSLFAYNVTDILCSKNDKWYAIPQSGTLGLEVHFNESLADNIIVLAWMEYDSAILIDQFKRVRLA